MKKLLSLFLLLALLLGSVLPLVGCPAPTPADPYADILSAYTSLLEGKAGGQTLSTPTGIPEKIAAALMAIVALDNDPAEMGYARRDINRDGIEELILMRRDRRTYALFTAKDGKAVMLLGEDPTTCISIDKNGEVYWNTGSSEYRKYLKDGALVGFEYGNKRTQDGGFVYYQIDHGEYRELDENDRYFLREYFSRTDSEIRATTHKAGFYFIPALPAESEAPVFDVSSYDAILAAYRRIVLDMADCTYAKWNSCAHDGLFRFDSAADYGIFFSIYHKCYFFRPTTVYYGDDYAEGGDNAYGYAYRDLDGDGTDELILLTDAAELIAIFTMKDGTPVFLPTATESWIDENGVIYNEYYEMHGRGNSVYEVEDGAFRMIAGYETGIDYGKQKGVYYLLVDGERVVSETGLVGTAFEGGAFDCKSGYTPFEYNKSHASLTFTPLFGRASATADRIGSYRNPYYISSGLLTISTLEGDTLTFSVPWLYSVGTPGEEDYESVVTDIAATAVRDENGLYRFTFEGAEGYIEFGATSIWVVITESDNPHLTPRARHYTVRTDD